MNFPFDTGAKLMICLNSQLFFINIFKNKFNLQNI